jgi:hypothetical protein
MDHQDVLEQLELAAVEPGGLDRLMAGDTPVAAAIAGHLAGCESCAGELERLRRAAPLLREVIRTTPPDDLRERTLAFVRAQGVPRGAAAAAAAMADGAPLSIPAAPAAAPIAAPVPAVVPAPHRLRTALPWVAAIAAAVVLSVVASAAIIGGRVDEQLASQQRTIQGLEAVTTATLAITADPAAERVGLTATGTTPASGSLLFSPSTADLVVVASGLDAPPSGQEYRCWVLVDGERVEVGRMYFAEDLAYWVGTTPVVSTVPAGTTFGVSLTGAGGSGPQTDPVIAGTL